MRHKVTFALEGLLFVGALAWCFYLGAELKREWSWRSAFELAVLGLLVWWPAIRWRLQRGRWP